MKFFKIKKYSTVLAAIAAMGVAQAVLAPRSEANVRLKILGDAVLLNTLGGLPNAGSMKFGGGAQLGFGLGKVVTFSIGGHYLPLGGASAVNYVYAPAGFEIYLLKWLYLKAGGYFSFLLSGNPGGYSSTDYGLQFGSGLDIPLGKIGFIVEGTYGMGLANVTGTSKWVFSNISVGLRFGGGGMK